MKETTIRLQKILSERGLCSRRGAEKLLNAGRVMVNGTVVYEPGLRICRQSDKICVDGKLLNTDISEHTTIIMNKPRGVICSRSDLQGETIYALLPEHLHTLRPAGRLDKDSEGLVVLSDDGELIHHLTHPRYGHAKTYRVTVSGEMDHATLKLLRSEMILDGYRIRPVRVTNLGPGSIKGRIILRFVLKEGRNRQIRNMCAQAGLRIHRLVREQAGPYSLAGLKPGEWRKVETGS
ncbi:MAG: rRNA pseudouridine synthase [Kiritimatiellae bacterium]|nr:rRNA pseudouridine synthase [Kiritimatiellia bacterium]